MAKIPLEIITEILLRLPAKSLGRFRCVSKGFQSLLSQPQFIKTHQTIVNRKHFILQVNSKSLFSLPFNSPKQATVVTPTKIHFNTRSNPHRPEIDMFTYHGSCNGLILVSGHDVDGGHTLLVINPVTTELAQIPETDYILAEVDIVFGFGYDSVTDDYKVVTLSFSPTPVGIPPEEVVVDVFSFKNNKWNRRVCDFPYNHSFGNSYSGVFVNGFLHWIAIKGFSYCDDDDDDYDYDYADDIRVIVAFSLADEKVSELALPEFCNGLDKNVKNKMFLVSGENIGVFVRDELWLMSEYGVRESWKKIVLSVFSEHPVVQREIEPVIFCENGCVVVVIENQVLMYDIEGRLCRRIDAKRFRVEGVYVESLVSLKLKFKGLV